MISLLFALVLAQEKAVVEGIVVNAITNEPLKKAHVTLYLDEKTSLEAVSGDRGKFRFEGFAPEVYQLQAQRQGFLYEDNGWIEVAAGEHVEDIVIKMTPQSAIAGHVVDEDGDPVPGAYVLVEHKIHLGGRAIVFDREEKVTDDEGYFFAGSLAAGRYYLTVRPPERESSNGPQEDLVRTEDPVPVDVATGAVMRNVEVRLRRGRVFHIHGNASDWPHPSVPIELMPSGVRVRLDDGKFAFEGVAPGNYFLNAFGRRGCPVPVTVGDRDVDGLAVEFKPGPSISGKITLEGDAHWAAPPIIGLQSGRWGPQFTGAAKEDGTFEWMSLAPEKYELDYTPPDGFYLKSVQFNHQPLPDRTIDLTSCAGGTLDIVLAPNAATISVTVRDAKDGKVTLWSDATLKTKDLENGVASFGKLAPGEYRILAWEKVGDQFIEIPEFRARFDTQKITVAEGSHETVEVKLILKSASDAEVAKLQ